VAVTEPSFGRLLAAAERIVAFRYNDYPEIPARELPTVMIDRLIDAGKVSRAYIAEHPADDDEPADAAWLTRGGWWIEIEPGIFLTAIEQGVERSLDGDEPWYLALVIRPSEGEMCYQTQDDESIWVPALIKTRGDVRRLCRVAKVLRSEPAPDAEGKADGRWHSQAE
jgi:hypothetical protein